VIREEWLQELIDRLRPTFDRIGSTLREKIRVSCGFPSKSALANKARRIGEYPHARLIASNLPKTQTTRMLKVTCKECGCVVRMTRKWLDEAGLPTCGCGSEMMEDASEELEVSDG